MEVLIAITILSIIITLSLLTFQSGLDLRQRAKTRVGKEESARSVLTRMTERIRTASPGPDPFLTNTLRIAQPNGYRFVGRNVDRSSREGLGEVAALGFARGLVTLEYLNVDNDGDGLVDEDPWNGLDDDGDLLVDEDPGRVPWDILNFTAPIMNSGDLELVEIGYGIEPSFPNSLRERFRVYHALDPNRRTFGTYRDPSGGNVIYIDNETAFALDAGALAELAEDIVGMDIHYMFKDGDGYLLTVNNWDTSDPAVVNAELGRAPDTDVDILADLPMLVQVSIWIADPERLEPPSMVRMVVAPANARRQ